jgi:hypothetical protein
MTSDDSLLADLRWMWHRSDPLPPGLVEQMIAAVAAADLDDELEMLVLVRDSATGPQAQVRGLATARVLYFQAAQGWSLDAEIDGDQVSGQLVDFDGDMRSVEVAVETTGGATWSTPLDEVGFFALRAELAGSVRFVVRQGDVRSVSGWVTL